MERPEHYYKLIRIILSLSGLWPYQNKWSAYLVRAVITIVLLSSIIFQLSSFLTSNITADFIVDVLSALLPTLGSLSHMYARVRHVDKLRNLFEHMWNDWKLQKTHYEIEIMHEHAETARLLMLYYWLVQYTAMIGGNIWLFLPDILDIISPMNKSRPRILPYRAEFFIDEERYSYLIRSHISIVLFVIPLAALASSTLCVILSQHACGMCELLGFVDMIQFYQTIPFLLDVLGLILSISFALMQILTIADNIDRAFRSTSIAVVILMYLFISNYMGQRIMDASSNACEKVYNSAWYNADVSEQKSLLLIMERRFHPLVLTACRFYVISLQHFGMILKTAISYCMFMRQI